MTSLVVQVRCRNLVLHTHRHLKVGDLILREYLLGLIIIDDVDLIPDDQRGMLLTAPGVLLVDFSRLAVLLLQREDILLESITPCLAHLSTFVSSWLAEVATLWLDLAFIGLGVVHDEVPSIATPAGTLLLLRPRVALIAHLLNLTAAVSMIGVLATQSVLLINHLA